MAGYSTPPTIDKALEQDMKTFSDIAAKDYNLIVSAMLSKALSSAGIINPKISLGSLIDLINKIIIPTIQGFEGGWVDHPTDTKGSAMRGVLATTFIENFDSIFINTGINDTKNAATSWNTKYPTWKADLDFAKKFLYVALSNPQVAGLFICKFFASGSNRYPIAIMTEDPFLGFFFAECCWSSGPTVYTKNRADFDSLLQGYGWSGSNSSWTSFIIGLGDKTPEVAINCIQKRFNQIMALSKPESKNGVFRTNWLDRLLNNKNSNLMMMVKINELFNLNENGIFKFTTNESNHLARKAAIYKGVDLDFPA